MLLIVNCFKNDETAQDETLVQIVKNYKLHIEREDIRKMLFDKNLTQNNKLQLLLLKTQHRLRGVGIIQMRKNFWYEQL